VSYLLEIVEELHRTDINGSALFNGRRICSVVTIICCLHRLIISQELDKARVSFRSISQLMFMLRLMPELQHQRCIDWEHLQDSLLTQDCTSEVFDAIYYFVKHLSCEKLFDQYEWLFALPVLHFLKKYSKPFEELILKSHLIPWNSKLGQLDSIRKMAYQRNFE